MPSRLALALLLAAGLRGCVVYEYEHELWLKVDGSGTVYVTGRPALWTAFKGLGRPLDPEASATREAARELFERSGLRVRRVTLTRRRGEAYLFVAADFEDVNKLAGTPGFPDLRVALRREGERLELEGTWARPRGAPDVGSRHRDGLMAVRFHMPSKIYEHRNAAEGVERGNILAWRQDVSRALDGGTLELGATLDRRSILWSTVGLFGGAILGGLGVLAAALYFAFRKGRKATVS